MSKANNITRVQADTGWRRSAGQVSLPEVHRSIVVPGTPSFWRKLAAFTGPGFLVAVGYMDPGNWATDLAGGARFGYALLAVIMISNLMAILLQHLCIKLGVATGRDLAQACRDHYATPTVWFLWILCEIAISACDLAEVVGSAIGLQLLFGIPLVWGCLITASDVLLVLYLQTKGFRYIDAIVITLIIIIGGCFTAETQLWWHPSRICSGSSHPRKSGDALCQYWDTGSDGDAAQSIFALVHRADTQIRANTTRQTGSDQVCYNRFQRRAHAGVIH